MALYLDTSGNSTLAIGLCARCGLKFAMSDLRPDVNYPGLLVCEKDADEYDPYRLAPRSPEDISIKFPRPDVPLTSDPVAPGDPSWPIR
ncbi:MAG: hypothetical protein JST01_28530 [Cyanobacteria bacterium SZAS TMP-1]|nr:hypothetical protein [Cyanobacteria bacterium SZAS TMP-1]